MDYIFSKKYIKTYLIIIICLFFIYYLSSVLFPFVLAFIICYIINPVINFIHRLVKSRYLALILFIITSLSGFTLFYKYVFPFLAEEMNNFIYTFDFFLQNDPFINQILKYLENYFSGTDYYKYFTVDNAISTVRKIFPFIFENVINITGGITFTIIFVFSFVLYFIYFFLDMDKITKSWRAYLPPAYKDKISQLILDVDKIMTLYFRKQLLVVLILFVLFTTGFLIVNIPLALFLGFLVAVLNFIPYMQILGIIPISLSIFVLSYETDISFWIYFLQVVFIFIIVQIIQDAILIPKIMGKMTGLHPSILLLSISIFGFLFGLVGLIIAIPLSTLLFSYYKRFVLEK